MSGIITATVVVAAVGLFIGLFLGVAAIKFKVDVDPREEAVLGALPGNNCGGCGFPGCSGMADSIVNGGNKNLSACRPCKPEAKAKIIEYLANTPGPDVTTITGVK